MGASGGYESWKMGPEQIAIIKENCSLTANEIRDMIKAETGMDVSSVGIHYHLTRIRKEAEKATIASSAAVDAKIEEFVDINSRDYLGFLDSNIRRLDRILRGEDPEYKAVNKDNKPSTYNYVRVSDMLGTQIERAFKIRPEVATLNLNLNKTDDIEEKLAKYEALYGEKKEG